MEMQRALGLGEHQLDSQAARHQLHLYINLKLASCGQPLCVDDATQDLISAAEDLLKNYYEKSHRLAADTLYPADRRIQDFLDHYLADL